MEEALKSVIQTALKVRGILKVIVCGSRTLLNKGPITLFLDQLPSPLTICEGGAIGADRLAELYYLENKDEDSTLAHQQYPANWQLHGRAAGHIRNREMLDKFRPDIVAAFYDEKKTKGTQHMVSISKEAGVYVYEEIVPPKV